jgi:hypothetical protein
MIVACSPHGHEFVRSGRHLSNCTCFGLGGPFLDLNGQNGEGPRLSTGLERGFGENPCNRRIALSEML